MSKEIEDGLRAKVLESGEFLVGWIVCFEAFNPEENTHFTSYYSMEGLSPAMALGLVEAVKHEILNPEVEENEDE